MSGQPTHDLSSEVAVLRRDVDTMTKLFDRFDTALTRFGDLAGSIKEMLAVHQEKHTRHDDVEQELFTLLEQRRDEVRSDVREIHARITTNGHEHTEAIAQMETRITDAITGMRKSLTTITDANAARIGRLEHWRWIVVGGGIVILFLINLITPLIPTLIAHR
jgi:uncharacterized protein YhaN